MFIFLLELKENNKHNFIIIFVQPLLIFNTIHIYSHKAYLYTSL